MSCRETVLLVEIETVGALLDRLVQPYVCAVPQDETGVRQLRRRLLEASWW